MIYAPVEFAVATTNGLGEGAFTRNVTGGWTDRRADFGTKFIKVSKGAKIRNRCNQVPHLTQYTNGKVTNSQLDTTNGSQEVSSFPAGGHKAHINRHVQSKRKTEKNIKGPQKKHRLGTVSKIVIWMA